MAVCLIVEGQGVTGAQYEQLHAEVAGDHPPTGLLYHVAGPTRDGWCVVEVWESPEALKRFTDEKLLRALERAGIAARPRVFEVATIVQP